MYEQLLSSSRFLPARLAALRLIRRKNTRSPDLRSCLRMAGQRWTGLRGDAPWVRLPSVEEHETPWWRTPIRLVPQALRACHQYDRTSALWWSQRGCMLDSASYQEINSETTFDNEWR